MDYPEEDSSGMRGGIWILSVKCWRHKIKRRKRNHIHFHRVEQEAEISPVENLGNLNWMCVNMNMSNGKLAFYPFGCNLIDHNISSFLLTFLKSCHEGIQDKFIFSMITFLIVTIWKCYDNLGNRLILLPILHKKYQFCAFLQPTSSLFNIFFLSFTFQFWSLPLIAKGEKFDLWHRRDQTLPTLLLAGKFI